MKTGTVALIGRPNVGKSSLVNTIIGQKVAITSPKPQTTRFAIHALYQEERGQILFIDTPGIFNKATDILSKKINQKSSEAFQDDIDAVMYVIDATRKRDFEEAKVLGIVRKIDKPKVLVYNKSDMEQKYGALYAFMEEEFDYVVHVSAQSKDNIKGLLNLLFTLVPERDTPIDAHGHPHPALNIDSKTFLSELIREKIFLKTRKELPYTTFVMVNEIEKRDNGMLYIQAVILTSDDKYKKMLIGAGGRKIKEIGSMARSELELATNSKVYLDLKVETDKHWKETLL